MTEFQCGVCHRSFSSLESCVQDLYSHHSSPKSCVVRGCGRTSRRLARHLKKSHRELCEYPCGNCSRVFVCAHDLKQHSDALHSGRVCVSNHQVVQGIAKGFSSLFQRHSGSTTTVDFRSRTTETDLNRFINANVQPTDAFNQEMQTTVEEVCTFLRQHMRPDEIVKGGSLGKGTAVRDNSDIDLVMVLNDVRGAQDLRNKLPEITRDVKEKLRGYQRGFTIVPNSLTETTFSVKFSVQGTNGNIDVDLLPTFEFEDLKSLYEQMRNDRNNVEYYSAALVKQQVDFVEEYPANVKNLIRLVKYWKKKMVRPSSPRRRIPNSYLMELITIHLWEKKSGGTFDTLKAFRGVMEALKDYQSLNAIWKTNYSTQKIPDEIRRQRPLVMDPANPTNNVCETFCWDEIKEEAERVLESSMMLGVSSTNWN